METSHDFVFLDRDLNTITHQWTTNSIKEVS